MCEIKNDNLMGGIGKERVMLKLETKDGNECWRVWMLEDIR